MKITVPSKEEAKEKLGELSQLAAKIAFGTVAVHFGDPVLGAILTPFAQEMFGSLLPNRRWDRVERMMVYLVTNLHGMNPDVVRERLYEPDFLDSFEQSVYYAAQARIDERLKVIAGILTTAFHHTEEQARVDKYLSLVSGLDDTDLALLLYIYDNQDSWRFKKQDIDSFSNHWLGTSGYEGDNINGLITHSINTLRNQLLVDWLENPDQLKRAEIEAATGSPCPMEQVETYYGLSSFGLMVCQFIAGKANL